MKKFEYDRLTPEQFIKALSDAGLSMREFCALTGSDVSRAKRWLKADDDPQALEPPFWVTSWLTLYMLPHASVMAANVAIACRYTDDETADAA